MLFSIRKSDGTLFYLLKDKEYTVGRKDCDILITNDQSISRKHALLAVTGNKVTLRDCGSRYNTFVENAKIEPNKDVPLESGSMVRFGVLSSNYTFHGINIVTTTSSIKSDQKASLKSNLETLGGSLIQNWNKLCTHVTVEEIMLTVKVLCAVIAGIPIVNLKYWDDYVHNVKQNLPPPNVENYKPPCSEIILHCQNLCLGYKEERRHLFKNRIFVFPTQREKDKMIDMIRLAGGDAISFDVSPINKEDIDNPSVTYLILQTSELDEKPNNELLNLISYIVQKGKRTIPLQEIALAIITCSCEKDCNPDFDRKGTVLAIKSQTESPTNRVVLANATESQLLFAPTIQNVKTETVIPQSLDIDLKGDFVDVKPSEDIKSIKREGDSIESLSVAKKFKSEAFFSTSNRLSKLNSENSEIMEIKNEVEEQSPRKSLFAFKNDKPPNEDGSDGPSGVVINPFAKKRKLAQNDVENPAKKSNMVSSPASSTGSSLLTPRSDPSSSGSVLKPRNMAEPSSALSCTRENNKKSRNAIASSTIKNNENVNSFQSELSRIEAVDSQLEKSFGWFSRSHGSGNSSGKKRVDSNGSMEEIDEEILKYIDSFKNTVIIEEEPLVVKAKSVINNNDESYVNNNVKNFKKFKKVSPLKEQTRIISNLVDIVCNDKSSHQTVNDQEDVDEDDDDMGMQINSRQRRGNRFRL